MRAVLSRPRSLLAAVVSAALVVAGAAAVVPSQAAARPALHADASQTETVTSRPDLVSARIAAASQNSRVEVTSLDDEYSTTYVNADGTETTDTSQTPLRVMQDGSWTPVDYTLQHVNGEWQPTASPVPVAFSDGADADAADVGNGAKEVDLSWDVTLPRPTVDGATATYDLGGGESLVLTATSTGFEQSLVLQNVPTSLPHIKLPLDTANLSMTSDGAGGFLFQNAGGDNVYEMPGPVMYGADVDPDTGEPAQTKPVSANLVQTGDGPQLDLTPSLSWLQDPSVTYPVTIDPSINSVTPGGDTFIQSNITTSQSSATFLHVGSYNGNAARAYLMFSGVSSLAGKDITSATLKLWNTGANTCTAAPMHAYALTSTFYYNNTWSDTKPTWTTTDGATQTFAHGVSGQCANAEVDFSVQTLVQDWASGQTNDGVQLSGAEAAGNQGWAFCSMNPDTTNTSSCTADQNHQPTLSVTYNSIPSASASRASNPCAGTCHSTRSSDTARPTLSVIATDADGGNLSYTFNVYSDSSGNNLVRSGSISGVTQGQRASWTVPADVLNDGHSYYWKARAYDGTDYGAWLPLTLLTIDTTAPNTPTLSSSTFTSGAWTTTASGSISWSSTSGDVTDYQYQLDNSDWTPTTATSKSFSFSSNSLHVLSVQALDAAGNVSNTATFTVGEGAGSMTSPSDGTSTQKQVLLTAAAPVGSFVEYQYEQGTTSAWTAVPSSDVTGEASGSAPTSWPWTPTATSDTSQTATSVTNWLWNAHHSLGVDSGAFELRACFSASSSGSSPSCQTNYSTVQLATGTFGDSSTTQQVGPGTLSLNTGDFSLSDTDADISAYDDDLSVSRSLTTLMPAAASSTAAGVFGPSWTSSLDGPDAGDADLTPTLASDKSSISFTDSTGSPSGTYTTSGSLAGSSITYTGTGAAADGSTVTYYTAAACPGSLATACITLAYPGDATTTWTKPTGSVIWAPYSVVAVPSAAGSTTSSYYYNSVGLPTQIVAPAPSGVDCSTQAKASSTDGCRSLAFTYASVTVGGSSVQRLSTVSLTAYNPATSVMATTAVAAYDYDVSGRLADAWDPRIIPALKTRYTYDSNSRLATLTPPGLNTWSFSYDSSNRLSTVSRPDPSGSTATTTIVYDIPVSGSNAPITLSGPTAATWGQTADLPTDGVAIFPATHNPAGTTVGTVSSSDWPWASITYMDYFGQDVDDAAYGAGAWQIGVTQYDTDGDTVWSLTPGNRAQALSPASYTDSYVASLGDSATRANLLATIDTYDVNGNLVDEQGPMHPAVITNGSSAGDTLDVRARSMYVYDSGSPNGNYYGLETSNSESVVDITGTNYDTQTTSTTYDAISAGDASGWSIDEPTTITDPSGLVTKDHYDNAGQLIAEQMPSNSGNAGVRTTDTTYYSVGSGNGCANTSFVGLVCSTQPDSQPRTGAALPTVSYTYDEFDNVVDKVETYGSGSSQVTRTSSTAMDSAERVAASTVTVTPMSAGGVILPSVAYSYSAQTGLLADTTTGSGASQQQIMRGYNGVGEQTSYSDADGNVATSSFDLNGRPASITDNKGTVGFAYDTNAEHRGLVTSENIGVAGSPSTFTANYNGDGNLSSETYPNGLVATTSYDNVQDATDLLYQMGSTIWTDFSASYNSAGQIEEQAGPLSSQSLAYDKDDRLTQVADWSQGSCTTRSYSFDNDFNRTQLIDFAAAADGSCSLSSGSSSSTYSYDDADRLTTSGYSYDALGRTLAVPSSDAVSSGAHQASAGPLSIGYYANDMVNQQQQGTNTIKFALDPLQNRVASVQDNSTTSINYYDDDTDSPSWTQTGSSWTRYIAGPSGPLQARVDQSGAVTLYLGNLHGDVVATTTDDASPLASFTEFNEYGAANNSPSNTVYGWLGDSKRSSDDLGGLVLMGVRLYDPYTGRFLSEDPTPGGNENQYIYPDDPINSSDVSGQYKIFGTSLGKHQLEWCARYFWDCAQGVSDANQARHEARHFPERITVDLSDALQHVLWMAWLSYDTDTKEALALGRAHEADTPHDMSKKNRRDSRRDLYNNKLGAEIGARVRDSGGDDQAIFNAVIRAMYNSKFHCIHNPDCVYH